MDEYMKLLGLRCRDLVTGFEGVVSTVTFDLYGCVQVILVPAATKDGKKEDGYWFDVKRLKILSRTTVMPVPNFNVGAGQERGPAEKPRMSMRG